ncbi:hypothetical protein Athai_04530 [Actinocatenispora thailandica]|uniref:DUF4383 domain-containing protein n=1 Tax=Actinocatenispora thailandica TaxID=227318 RepID=A0A7R7DJM8_9ACTN|nr:DUF4383 domain-containing protein [Actinocatenispora thailandica]BCJ32950.1 hypothetical protein Athai_04530 [Actinocatenispora thailandica]
MASHLPVNHHMRSFWRVLSTLAGLYILIFGIVGVVQTSGMAAFATEGIRVLGLTTNPGFSAISIAVGAVIFLASVIGRNVDVVVNLIFGCIFVLAGLFSLAFLRTDLNYFAFSVTNCIVSYLLGGIVGLSSLYGRVRRTVPARTGQHAAA